MGRARDLWEELGTALEKRDDEALLDLYAPQAVYLEPLNPPHEGNLLIQAYLKDWMRVRDNLTVATKRILESADGLTVAVEWALSYAAAGRRWNDLPRCSWFEVEADGITYHRDYF